MQQDGVRLSTGDDTADDVTLQPHLVQQDGVRLSTGDDTADVC